MGHALEIMKRSVDSTLAAQFPGAAAHRDPPPKTSEADRQSSLDGKFDTNGASAAMRKPLPEDGHAPSEEDPPLTEAETPIYAPDMLPSPNL